MDRDKTCEVYLSNWIDVILEENEEQLRAINDNNLGYVPFVATAVPAMKMLFELSKTLQISREATYLAVHIYDKFMYKIAAKLNHEISKSMTRKTKLDAGNKFSRDKTLYIVTCLLIANKVDTNEMELSLTKLVQLLNRIDPHKMFTKHSLITCEMSVYKILNWKLPTYTVLNCVELLLASSGLHKKIDIPNICRKLLDTSYLKHEKLYSKLMQLSHKNYDFQMDNRYRLLVEANLLFLAASVVLCSTYVAGYGRHESRRIALLLEEDVKIFATDIKDFAKVLFDLVRSENNDFDS